jgi:cardiolipin synthase
VLFLVLAPYAGLPLFLLFGTRKVARPTRHARPVAQMVAQDVQLGPGTRCRLLARALGLPPPVSFTDLAIHRDGAAALERLRELLLSARHTLEVSSFLLGRDEIGAMVMGLLAQRAQEGGRVRLLIDGVGRYLGGHPNLRRLRAAGVEVGLFACPWSSPLRGRMNLRNHRKAVVADGQWLWTGGRNLAAEYFVGTSSHGHRLRPWVDLSFDLRGTLARQVGEQFERDWAVAVGDAPPADRHRVLQAAARGEQVAQLLPSGPDQGDDTVYGLLIDACFNASNRVLALTPYFVPDPVLLMAFELASRRGVAVDLVVPRRSNHRLADLARPQALRDLLDAGGRVWLAPSMLHAKLVIVDDTVALAGSLNLDERSLFLNYEMMVAFYDAETIGRFSQWAELVRSTAQRQPPYEVSVLCEVGEGLLRWLTFQL